MARLRCLLPALALVVSGCCTKDRTVGRYKSATCGDASDSRCSLNIPQARVYVASIKTASATPPVKGTSLPERALAEYIKVLGDPKVSPTPSDLRTNLAAELSAPSPGDPGAEDRTLFHRTLIVTVRKEGDFNPVDRLEATEIVLRPQAARFESWDSLATVYTTIDAGSVQLTQVRGATESLSVGSAAGAPVSATAGATGTQTNTRAETFNAVNQVETVTASIEDGALRIHRQGGYGVDLTGNTVIKVDLAYAANPSQTFRFKVASYVDKRGKALPPEKIKLISPLVAEVPPGRELCATATLSYTLRHVKSGDNTYEEGDDVVQEITRNVEAQRVILVPAREASRWAFGLAATAGHENAPFLVVQRPERAQYDEMYFDTYGEAVSFLGYLLKSPTSSAVGGAKLGFLDHSGEELRFIPLKRNELSSVQVEASWFGGDEKKACAP